MDSNFASGKDLSGKDLSGKDLSGKDHSTRITVITQSSSQQIGDPLQ
jgi:hypothetical protein